MDEPAQGVRQAPSFTSCNSKQTRDHDLPGGVRPKLAGKYYLPNEQYGMRFTRAHLWSSTWPNASPTNNKLPSLPGKSYILLMKWGWTSNVVYRPIALLKMHATRSAQETATDAVQVRDDARFCISVSNRFIDFWWARNNKNWNGPIHRTCTDLLIPLIFPLTFLLSTIVQFPSMRKSNLFVHSRYANYFSYQHFGRGWGRFGGFGCSTSHSWYP